MTPRARVNLSISVSPKVKLLTGLVLAALAAGAAAGMILTRGWVRLPFLLVLPIIAHVILRLARHRWWLDGTVIYKQKAFRAKRIDLAHANVDTGYVARGSQLTSIKARDPIARRKLTVPLLTASGRTLPPQEIKCIHDAIISGQRFRRKGHLERAATVCSYLQTLA